VRLASSTTGCCTFRARGDAELFAPTAAANCTTVCDKVCGLNASAFVPVTQGVSSYTLFSPGTPFFPITRRPTTLALKHHAQETYWLDPRRQMTYCQWTWVRHGFVHPEG
jgi:hypothetical protein